MKFNAARGLMVAPLVAVVLTSCTSQNPSVSSPTRSATGAPVGSNTSPAPTVAAGPASSLQDQYINVVKTITPSVVQIETTSGLGSGIVFDSQGDIVTNAHVVSGATSFTVTTSDGKKQPATLVGSFVPDDLAVIRVSGTAGMPANFADSGKLVVGDIVLAVGNPLGLQSSVSEGIVSAVGRTVPEGNGVTLPNVIQTSAAINPGNSGGALVDLTAAVVGIPTLAAVDPQLGGGAAPGIGFAIPSNTVKDIATQLIQNNGKVTNSHRAYLGVKVSGSAVVDGALIVQVVAGSPAAKAGLATGDLITAVNDQPVHAPSDLTDALAAMQPGALVTVKVTHQDGTTGSVSATLAELPGG